MSLQDKASIVLPKGFAGKAGTLECWNPNSDSLVGLSVVRATTATRVNESGLIESVAANVPRRDFTNGGCGDLLVEPQRTNLEQNSQDITAANYFDLNLTFNNNATTAPDGTTTADQLTVTSNGNVQLSNNYTVTGSTDYTCSVFIKKQSGATDLNGLRVTDNDGGTTILSRISINLDTGAITQLNGTGAYSVSYNDNWWRVVMPVTTGASATFLTLQPIEFASQTAGESVYLWGVQVEQAAYATSYIPTSGSAVTRNADVISGTSLAALLGDSAGGIYVNASVFEDTFNGVSINDATANNRFRIGTSTSGRFTVVSSENGTIQTNLLSTGGLYTTNAFFKIAARYSVNDVNLYHNGSSIITDASWSSMNGVNKLELKDPTGGPFYGRIRELVIFSEAPSDTQLAAITTP